jgi:hypothetical protein
MLNGLLETKKEKQRVFQVLLLNNDASQDVEVHEAKQVDFLRVQEHLKQGGSVFITSKGSQKISLPKEKQKPLRNKSCRGKVTVFYFDHL